MSGARSTPRPATGETYVSCVIGEEFRVVAVSGAEVTAVDSSGRERRWSAAIFARTFRRRDG